MTLDVLKIDGSKSGEKVTLADNIVASEPNDHAIDHSVKAYLANQRQGTHKTKELGEVRGGGKKPWRQKGTGRARAGTSRSPIWRGGGTVFGPHPRDYGYSLPKKVRRKALISALSMKFKDDKMMILRDFPLEEISTKAFHQAVSRLGMKKALFVIDAENTVLLKSSRNIKDVKMIRSEGINVYDILKYEHLVLLEPSVKKIEGALLA